MYRIYGIAIFLLAFTVRFSSTVRHAPAPDNGYESTRVALSLAHRGAFADPFLIPTGPTAHVAPAFPLILSVVYRVFGEGTQGEIAKRFLNCFVSSLQYALLPWIAMACGLSRGAAIAAALFGAVIPLQRYAESASSWESSWAAVLLMLLVAMARRGSAGGPIWGVALLFAPALASVYAGFLALLRWPWRKVALSLAMTALCLAPWAYRNRRELGSWIFLRDNFGLELSVSNRDGATPRLAENLRTGSHNATHPHGSVAEADKVRELGEIEYNRGRFREALAWIDAHPGRFARLTAARVFYFWFPWVASPFERILLALVTLFALAGIVRTHRIDRLSGRIFAIVWIVFPIVYYVIEFDRRYRHPIEWTFLLMSAQGVLAVWDRLRVRRAAALFLTIAAALSAQVPRAALSPADALTLSKYRLSMDNVTKVAVATKSLKELTAADPSLKKKFQANGAETIDSLTSRLNASSPKIVSAIASAGLSTRDYALTLMSLMLSAEAYRLREHGKLNQLPPGISAENLSFVATHKTELAALIRAIRRAST